MEEVNEKFTCSLEDPNSISKFVYLVNVLHLKLINSGLRGPLENKRSRKIFVKCTNRSIEYSNVSTIYGQE